MGLKPDKGEMLKLKRKVKNEKRKMKKEKRKLEARVKEKVRSAFIYSSLSFFSFLFSFKI